MSIKFKFILLSIFLGIIAYLLGEQISYLNSILVGFLLGVLVGNLVKLQIETQSHIRITGNRFLEFSILFIAFGVNFSHFSRLGWETLWIIILVVFLVLLVTVFLSKNPMKWMIGFGTAICGSSAIAALAPAISKEKSDVGIAMAVVNLYGAIGMLVFPVLLLNLDLTPIEEGLAIGGSLHSVGNVVVAGYTVSDQVAELALTTKLARVSLLSFGLIFFNFILKKGTDTNWKSYLKLPWYIWGFIMISVFVSFVQLPENSLKFIDLVGKLLITIAMVNIGILVQFKVLLSSGKKGLVFGAMIWGVQLSILSILLIFLK